MSIVCTDVAYADGRATAAAVVIEGWSDARPAEEATVTLPVSARYTPGEFYRRELPGLLAVLNKLESRPDCVVVDGHAWLAVGRPGLGAHLYEALGRSTPVVGVAKSPFSGNDAAIGIRRGRSKKPLYVSACGLDSQDAARWILAMHGVNRIPTILKRADDLSHGRRF